MGRWKPDARGRLERAALELFEERGFDGTTVVDIVKRAGLAERTFYRCFADKREVLSAPSDEFERALVASVDEAPAGQAPITVLRATFLRVGEPMQQRAESVRQRQRVIAANAGLFERELVKVAKVVAGIAEALRRRGVGEPAASLAAEAAMGAFKTAMIQWVASCDGRPLTRLINECFDELRLVTAAQEPQIAS
jgi:AcrR family transcriptional regulator